MLKKQLLSEPASIYSKTADDAETFLLVEADPAMSQTLRFWAAMRLEMGYPVSSVADVLLLADYLDRKRGKWTCGVNRLADIINVLTNNNALKLMSEIVQNTPHVPNRDRAKRQADKVSFIFGAPEGVVSVYGRVQVNQHSTPVWTDIYRAIDEKHKKGSALTFEQIDAIDFVEATTYKNISSNSYVLYQGGLIQHIDSRTAKEIGAKSYSKFSLGLDAVCSVGKPYFKSLANTYYTDSYSTLFKWRPDTPAYKGRWEKSNDVLVDPIPTDPPPDFNTLGRNDVFTIGGLVGIKNSHTGIELTLASRPTDET